MRYRQAYAQRIPGPSKSPIGEILCPHNPYILNSHGMFYKDRMNAIVYSEAVFTFC